MSGRGRFVVFEGGEGSGKSTQAAILAERWGALLTRQPGGTALGVTLRSLLLDVGGAPVDPRAEALLMAADRAQHVAEVIEPALASGRDVVCDRYVGSSVAYQGYGRGLDPTEISGLSTWATGGLDPDLVVLLVVPEATAEGRLQREHDRFERAGVEFHRRVAAGFAAQAEASRSWATVDGDGTIDEVGARVAAVVDRRWPAR